MFYLVIGVKSGLTFTSQGNKDQFLFYFLKKIYQIKAKIVINHIYILGVSRFSKSSIFLF